MRLSEYTWNKSSIFNLKYLQHSRVDYKYPVKSISAKMLLLTKILIFEQYNIISISYFSRLIDMIYVDTELQHGLLSDN